MRFLYSIACCGSLLLAATLGEASEIDVSKGACGAGVHLVANGARLSEVLKRLAEKLDFKLEFKATSDPVISVDVSRPAAELIAKLAPSENVIVSHAQDPRCPSERRVAKVWVLPNANGAAARLSAPAQAAAPAASADQERRERMMKLRKELEDAYVKQHGVPAPTGEEEILK